MRISEYMKKNKLTYRQLEAETGVPHSSLYYYEKGMKVPLLSTAYQIQKKTEGKIKMLDLLTADEIKKIDNA